ncbi:putative periplasmic protein [plant metagenome]|uniref:Putative periplasmic protein n=2 Tax=plant metagenome TaxID=1297885 RepID=A0A484U995_9ZZZZ
MRALSSLPSASHGAAMIEFTVAATVLLGLALAALETAHWHRTRQLLGVALLEAARAGSTAGLAPGSMADAFETGLLPLYATASTTGARARLRQVHVRRAQAAGLPAWRIDILSPRRAHFLDFNGGNRTGGFHAAPVDALSPDYLPERHAAHRQRWPGGRGPRSGDTVLDAAVLHLRLRYLHAPLTPGLGALARALGRGRRDAEGQAMARAGLLPIVLELRLTMQSLSAWPADWSGGQGEIVMAP